LSGLVREHLVEDVLARVQEQPRWRDDVEVTRQKLACRHERRSV
jgi:hypothetical protein